MTVRERILDFFGLCKAFVRADALSGRLLAVVAPYDLREVSQEDTWQLTSVTFASHTLLFIVDLDRRYGDREAYLMSSVPEESGYLFRASQLLIARDIELDPKDRAILEAVPVWNNEETQLAGVVSIAEILVRYAEPVLSGTQTLTEFCEAQGVARLAGSA